MNNKKYIFAEAILLLGVFACAVSMIFKNYVWFDESFTLNLVQHSLPEMIRLTALDVHPPLYYILVKVFTWILGANHLAFYLPSVLSFLALLAVTCWFFGKHFSHKTGLFTAAVFCAAPNMLKYAMQLRMYSLAMFLVTLAFYLVYILCKGFEEKGYQWNKYWTLLVIVNVLAAYTHYFAGVAAVGVSLVLLLFIVLGRKGSWKKGLLNWAIYCGAMLVLYLPWIPTLFRQMSAVNEDYWIGALTENSLHSYPEMIFYSADEQMRLLLIAVYLVGFFLLFMQFEKRFHDMWTVGCYGVVGIWFAFGIGYSVVGSPILVDRYVAILLPLLWIPICVTYAGSAYKYLSVAVIFLFAVCFTQNYESLYNEYAMASQNELVAYLDQNVAEDDIFFHMYVQDLSIGAAYFEENEHYAFHGVDTGQAFHYWEELTDCHMIHDLDELQDIEGTVWCFNGDYLGSFVEEGWIVEPVELVTATVYKIYR